MRKEIGKMKLDNENKIRIFTLYASLMWVNVCPRLR